MIAVGIETQPAPVPPPSFPLKVAFMPVYMSLYYNIAIALLTSASLEMITQFYICTYKT